MVSTFLIRLLGASFVSLTSAIPPPLAPLASAEGFVTNGGHVVVLKSTANLDDTIASLVPPSLVEDPRMRKFDLGLKGYAGKFDHTLIEKMRKDPRVAYIEPDYGMHTTNVQSQAEWGLAVSSEKRKLARNNMTNYYFRHSPGKGVTVYVIDSGIWTRHPDFEGRAKMVADFVSYTPEMEDDDGHGTHCSGTVGGAKYGIAKAATIAGIKVLDQSGQGYFSALILGINYAIKNCEGGKCVMSISSAGPKSDAVNQAVENAVRAGIPVVVAAGNDNADACVISPASAPAAITVGAIDSLYNRANFSNYGSCVDVFAPGVGIYSNWLGGTHQTLTGTSMAAPHVAGIVASYMSSDISTDATSMLIRKSQKNLVKDVRGSPNRIANNGYWLKVSDQGRH